MHWGEILQALLVGAVGSVGFIIRRGWRKYEHALKENERLRAAAQARELEDLKTAVTGFHVTVAKLTHNEEVMRKFIIGFARKFTTEIAKTLKLSQKDADQLKGVLDGLTEFLGSIKNGTEAKINISAALKESTETDVKQIGKDSFLVHTHKKKGG